MSIAALEFDGAINLTDWWQDTEEHGSFNVIVGHVKVLTEDDLGFKLRTSGNANYLVTVTGPTGMKISFPGCKVYGFEEFARQGEYTAAGQGVYVVR